MYSGDNIFSLKVRYFVFRAQAYSHHSFSLQDIKEGLSATISAFASLDQNPWNVKGSLEYKDDNLDSKVEFDAATKGDMDLSFVVALPDQKLLLGSNIRASPTQQTLQDYHVGIVHDLTSDSTVGLK